MFLDTTKALEMNGIDNIIWYRQKYTRLIIRMTHKVYKEDYNRHLWLNIRFRFSCEILSTINLMPHPWHVFSAILETQLVPRLISLISKCLGPLFLNILGQINVNK